MEDKDIQAIRDTLIRLGVAVKDIGKEVACLRESAGRLGERVDDLGNWLLEVTNDE
jgi:hypothetical protein